MGKNYERGFRRVWGVLVWYIGNHSASKALETLFFGFDGFQNCPSVSPVLQRHAMRFPSTALGQYDYFSTILLVENGSRIKKIYDYLGEINTLTILLLLGDILLILK